MTPFARDDSFSRTQGGQLLAGALDRGGTTGSRIVEICLASGILVLAAPLLLTIGAAIWLLDGRPLLHRGTRLGVGKRPFKMNKFRTLTPDAHRIIGSDLLDHRHDVKTRTGDFLRETRLDELPQLINVICGDMTFFGPRPVRPEVYEKTCAGIRHYDLRFKVRPGLIGYSQLFTPHGAPKRLRARIDNRSVLHPPSLGTRLLLIGLAARVVLGTAARRTFRMLAPRRGNKSGHPDRRSLRRKRSPLASVRTGRRSEPNAESIGELVDINERSFRLRSPGPLRAGDLHRVHLRIEHTAKQRRRVKEARCLVEPRATRRSGATHDYVFDYVPYSENSRYVIDQYLLEKSVSRVQHSNA